MSIWLLVIVALVAWTLVTVAVALWLGRVLRERRRTDSIEIPPFIRGGTVNGPTAINVAPSTFTSSGGNEAA